MSELIDQPDPTTNRKVRWATTAGALTAPVAMLLAMSVTSAVPAFDSAQGFAAVQVIAEVLITSAITAASTWATGYFVREENVE